MDNYFNSYKEMISLRGLSDHTLKSYCTYIRAYLDYLLNRSLWKNGTIPLISFLFSSSYFISFKTFSKMFRIFYSVSLFPAVKTSAIFAPPKMV